MKHLRAGLIVGLIVAAALFLGALVWGILSSVLGPGAASAMLVIVIVAMAAAAIIDWKTEKKEDSK